MIGNTSETENTIYIIDFGLSKCYISEDGVHIPFKEGKPIAGTLRYISINTHKEYEQSRRDDLESIGHLLLYLLIGQLPWQDLPSKNAPEKRRNIRNKKIEIKVEDLCKG